MARVVSCVLLGASVAVAAEADVCPGGGACEAAADEGGYGGHRNDLFSSPLKRSASPIGAIVASRLEIDEAAVASFWEKGYYIPDEPVLAPAEVAKARAAFVRAFEGHVDRDGVPQEFEFWQKSITEHAADASSVRKINNAWWVSEPLKSLATARALGEAAARLLNTTETRVWHDQAIWKPPSVPGSDAGNIGWHQDYGFWRVVDEPRMVTAWIALQDTTLANGAMRTIRGSHKWGLVEGSNGFFSKDLEAQRATFAERGRAAGGDWEDVPTELRAGQVAFHHCLTFHGSGPNRSPDPRLAFAVHMLSAESRYKPGVWHSNVRDLGPDVKAGDLFAGPAFPTIYASA